MRKDYSEYVPSEQEQYLRRQGNQFIELEYFTNSVRFNTERKTLDVQVDGKKESLWMDELVEKYEVAREERLGEEFLGLEEAAEEDWKENEEDVERLDRRYCISYFPFEDILKSDQFYEMLGVEPRRVPMNNVLSGTNVNLNYGEGLLDFIYADFDEPAQTVIRHLERWEFHTGTPAEKKTTTKRRRWWRNITATRTPFASQKGSCWSPCIPWCARRFLPAERSSVRR